MTRARLVTLCNEVHHILIGGRERQVLRQHRFYILSSDKLSITLIEEAEAFLGFFIFTGFLADALIPMVGDHVFHKLEVNAVAL